MELKNFEKIVGLKYRVEPCGSRVTCSPPLVGTDADYLVELVEANENHIADVMRELGEMGFEWEGSTEHYQTQLADGFSSWRKEDVNLIVTSNPLFASRHRCATALCTRLNLQDKPDRIALFQAVLYGNVHK